MSNVHANGVLVHFVREIWQATTKKMKEEVEEDEQNLRGRGTTTSEKAIFASPTFSVFTTFSTHKCKKEGGNLFVCLGN
jgi:hypothetical protein